MLDRFRRGQSKQTKIKLYLRFVSPTLLARGHDPLFVRRFRRKKYSVSTRMEYVQTKLMNCYSPVPPSYPRPFQTPFDCCIAPLSIPSSCALSAFCWFFTKQYLQPTEYNWYEPMASRQSLTVCEHGTINAPGRQYTLLTGSLPIQQGRYKRRKG